MGAKSVLVDATSVRHAYRRWAPIYDFTFGTIADAGRKHVVKIINRRKGRVLEVGVGTGLSLPSYGEHLTVTGIDLSPEMLGQGPSAGRSAKGSPTSPGSMRWMPARSPFPTRASTPSSPCM